MSIKKILNFFIIFILLSCSFLLYFKLQIAVDEINSLRKYVLSQTNRIVALELEAAEVRKIRKTLVEDFRSILENKTFLPVGPPDTWIVWDEECCH